MGGVALVIGLGAGWFGCSSSSSDAATGDDAGADAATSKDGGTDASADSAVAGSGDRIGAVFAISDTTAGDGGAKHAYRAGASFTHTTTPDGTTQSKTVGPCVVETIGDGTAAQEEDVSAGVVHIQGGSKNVDLTPMGDNTYAPQTAASLLFGGGETLTASAEGKDKIGFEFVQGPVTPKPEKLPGARKRTAPRKPKSGGPSKGPASRGPLVKA